MKDDYKSKQQLIDEVATLRQQVTELQAKYDSAEHAPLQAEAVGANASQLERLGADLAAELKAANEQLRQELSERKQVEQALRENEGRYRRLVEFSFETIVIHREGKIIYVNAPGANLFGAASPAELINKSIRDLVHPDYLATVEERLRQIKETGQGASLVEEKLIRLDGKSVDVEVAAVPITYQEQPAVQVVIRDITRRKRAEIERERLLAAEKEQRLLAETLGDVFLTLTAQTRFETVLDEILRQVQRIVRYSAANIMLLKHETLYLVRHQGYDATGGNDSVPNRDQSLAAFPLDAQVVQSRQPLVVPDTHQNPQWVTLPELAWIRSFIAMPIRLGDQVLGLLRLDSDSPGKFSTRDLGRLQSLANAAAIALQNARLYDQARRELAKQVVQAETEIIQLNRKLLTLQYAGATVAASSDLQLVLDAIAREMANLLKVEGCAIFEWDQIANRVFLTARHGLDNLWQEGVMLERYAMANFSLMNRVLVERRAQQITSSHTDIYRAELAEIKKANLKTLLMVPMEFQHQVVGLVKLMDGRNERTFANREIALVQLLANQAASAIENSRLYGQLRQEIVERMQAEKELRQVAVKQQAMLAAIPDSMFYFSRDGKLLDYKVARDGDLSLGILDETINSINGHDLEASNLIDLIRHYVDQTLTSGQMQAFEYQLSLPQGIQNFEARLVTSSPNEVLAIVRDITHRKRAEEALQKSEANLRAIFDNSLQAFVLFDRDHVIQAFNKAARAGFRLVLRKKIREGDSAYDFVPKTELDEFNRSFNKALQGESVSIEKYVNIGNKGMWFELNYYPVLTPDGQVIGVCFSTVNIDEHKRMTEALVESEDRLLAELQSALIITRALVSEIDLNSLLEFIMIQAEDLTNADGAVVFLLSEDGEYLEVAAPGNSWLPIEVGSRIRFQGSLAELAITTKKVKIYNQAVDDDGVATLRTLLQPAEIESFLFAPLVAQDKNLGVLLIWGGKDWISTVHNTRLIGLFADQAALALYNANLHARNRQLAIEQERHRLARELHDSVTQSLYSIGLASQAALRLMGQDADSEVRDPIDYVHSVSQTALTEMREQLYHLRPTVLNQDLIEALAQHCDTLRGQYALAIEFKAKLEFTLASDQRDALYYIAREALWNIVRHAKATHVNISLSCDSDHVRISIDDDGVGFDPLTIAGKENRGLRNMEERAKLLAGKLELLSEPGQGTRLAVRIPIQPI